MKETQAIENEMVHSTTSKKENSKLPKESTGTWYQAYRDPTAKYRIPVFT